MNIARLSIRRPVTTIMLFVSMMLVGVLAAFRLPLEALPDISAPFMYVALPYPGSNPDEVEQTVLRPAEEALATMSGLKKMYSRASADEAGVFLEFSDWDRDIAIAASEARERLDAARDQLPDDFQRYFVYKWSTADQPVLRVRLAGATDLSNAYALIDRDIKRHLERVSGVARVEINGAPPNEVEIALDPNRLTAHGLAINDIAQRLRTVNFSLSAGLIDDAGQRLRVQPVGELTDLQQLRDLVIDGRGTKLSDIAKVQLQPVPMDYGRRLDGRAAVGLDIYKERDANLVDVTRQVLATLNTLKNQSQLRGVEVKVMQDMGEEVTSSLKELAEAGALGLLLSTLVLYFFLRHAASTLMVSLSIPICFLIALGFMYFFDLTLNILTLMGLLLAVGMLVDNAVVVVESIYQERERIPHDPVQASVLGTRHVAIALSAGTLSNCIVFLPNLFGKTTNVSIFMSQLAVTITVSLMASWLVAISLIPMLSSRLKTPPAVHNQAGVIFRLQQWYGRVLAWSLAHRGKTVLLMLCVIIASILPMSQAKMNFFGSSEGESQVNIWYQFNGNYKVEQLSEEVARVEAYLDANRERFAIAQIYSWFSESNGANTEITLRDDAEDVAGIREQIRQGLPESARAKIGVGQREAANSGGLDQGVSVQLVGDSTEVLKQLGETVLPNLAARPELRDVRIDAGAISQELNLQVDRERAAAFGFSTQDVAAYINLALRGGSLREFRQGAEQIPVWVRFENAQSTSLAQIESFMVRAPDGRMVPLAAMVQTALAPAAAEINRFNRETTLTIKANLSQNTSRADAQNAMRQVLDALQFPAGYRYSFDGSSFQADNEGMQQMLFNLLLAVVLIYVLMAAVFESLLFPLAIMSCVLFSILGVFWLFWITGTEFTIMVFIGILILMGVVVNNGIIMVEHINTLRRQGVNRTQALIAGSRERLRPILMTMGTAILAMIPISMGDSTVLGGLEYAPMARAVAGGLAFSTVVSLLFLPTIYAILDDWSNRVRQLWQSAVQSGRANSGKLNPLP